VCVSTEVLDYAEFELDEFKSEATGKVAPDGEEGEAKAATDAVN